MLFISVSFYLLGVSVLNIGAHMNRIAAVRLSICIALVSHCWTPVAIFNGSMSFNGVCTFGSLLVIFLGRLLLSYDGYKFAGESYPIFGVCSILGSIVIMSSCDIITLFLGIELQSFSVYLRTGSNRGSLSSTGASLKYFLLGALGTAMVLLGGVTQYSTFGTTSLGMWQNGLVFLRAGVAFKIAATPFHGWAPDVYDGVSSAVSGWLQVMPKIGLVILLLNIPYSMWGFGVLSVVVGSVYGVAQSRVRRMLAYSTVSHVGFILLCSDWNMALYLGAYSITTRGALLVLGILIPGGKIASLRGLGRKRPVLASSFGVILFSLAGIPPLLGFYAKARVLQELRYSNRYGIGIIVIVCSVISASYYTSLIGTIFFRQPESTTRVSPTVLPSYVVSICSGVVLFYSFAHPITVNLCKMMVRLIYALGFTVRALIMVLFLANYILAQKAANAQKASAYECGFEAVQQTRSPFNIMYYLVGVRFLLLDLEVALLFPVIVSLGPAGTSMYGFYIRLVFLGLLTIGFVYEFGKGALHIASQRASINRSKI